MGRVETAATEAAVTKAAATEAAAIEAASTEAAAIEAAATEAKAGRDGSNHSNVIALMMAVPSARVAKETMALRAAATPGRAATATSECDDVRGTDGGDHGNGSEGRDGCGSGSNGDGKKGDGARATAR